MLTWLPNYENLLLRNTDQKFPCGWCWQTHNVKCYGVCLCLLRMEDYWPCEIEIPAIYCSASFAQGGKNKNLISFVGGRCGGVVCGGQNLQCHIAGHNPWEGSGLMWELILLHSSNFPSQPPALFKFDRNTSPINPRSTWHKKVLWNPRTGPKVGTQGNHNAFTKL